MTAATELVFDASAVYRGITIGGDAGELLRTIGTREIVGHAPDLIVAELANAFVRAVRAERLSPVRARALFGAFSRSPMELHSTKPLASSAIDVAVQSGLTAYDAFYAVLARALDVPLVTADRKLAAAVPEAVLVA